MAANVKSESHATGREASQDVNVHEKPGSIGTKTTEPQHSQRLISCDDGTLEEWYNTYKATTHEIPRKFLNTLDGDVLNDESTEKEVIALMPSSQVVGGFCSKCQNIFDDWPWPSFDNDDDDKDKNKDTFVYTVYEPWERRYVTLCHRHVNGLEASRRNGCRLCAMLIQTLIDSNLLWIYRAIEQRLRRLTKPTDLRVLFDYDLLEILLDYPGLRCSRIRQVHTIKITLDKSSDASLTRQVTNSAKSPFDLAAFWYSQCRAEHEKCKLLAPNAPPTRLLSVATDPPRLVRSVDLMTTVAYSTLSHCWGARPLFCLTHENLESLYEGISLDRFPKTFRDAITATRSLGLDYIWIDSLCIIQGDMDDWEKEAATMASVYSGSAINIAASSAIDGSQGCFLKPRYFNGGFHAQVTVKGVKDVYEFWFPETYAFATVRSHLATRAWAMQEKLLSPRTLHCGNRGLFWECREMMASEFLPAPNDNKTWDVRQPLVCRQATSLAHSWEQTVAKYSGCNLTRSTDKLVALSGVARAVHNETQDEYVVGMWRQDLEYQLCWVVYDKKRRPTYRAPSWSWASIDGTVGWTGWYGTWRFQKRRHLQLTERTYTRIRDVNVTAVSDAFGQVSGGVLTLACSVMATANVGRMTWARRRRGAEDREVACLILACGHRWPLPPEYTPHICMDCIEDGIQGTVYILPLYARSRVEGRRPRTSRTSWIVGLLLQAAGIGKGTYRRIGCFNLDDKISETFDDSGRDEYRPFMAVLEEFGAITARNGCSEIVDDPEHPYIITIV